MSLTTHVVHNKFNGHVGLVVCLIVSLFTFGIEFLARGAFAGMGRFGAYGLSLGGRRHHPVAAVHPARARGRHQPVLVRPVPRGSAAARDGRRDVRAERARAARAVRRRGRSCRATSGTCSADRCSRRCSATRRSSARRCSPSPTSAPRSPTSSVGLFLSRIPILLFQAVQAALLPKLSTLVTRGPRRRLPERRAPARAHRRRHRRARRDRGRDDRTVRRPHPVRRQVQPRQRRRRAARCSAAACSSWRSRCRRR